MDKEPTELKYVATYEVINGCEYCGGNVTRESDPNGKVLYWCPRCFVFHSYDAVASRTKGGE